MCLIVDKQNADEVLHKCNSALEPLGLTAAKVGHVIKNQSSGKRGTVDVQNMESALKDAAPKVCITGYTFGFCEVLFLSVVIKPRQLD